MNHWHKCRRWERRKLRCPYLGVVHEEIEDDDDDDDDQDDDDTIDKIPVPGRKKQPPKQDPVSDEWVKEFTKEAEKWVQEPIPQVPVKPPQPALPPAQPVYPEPTKVPAPVPEYAPIPQLFPTPALKPLEAPYRAGALPYQPAAVLAPLMQQSFEGVYKAGNTSTATVAKGLADGLYKAPRPTATQVPSPYYGRGPDVAAKPVAATVEAQLAKQVSEYIYKPIQQPSVLDKVVTKVKPLSPYLMGAAAVAGGGGFIFNWAAKLKSMTGGF